MRETERLNLETAEAGRRVILEYRDAGIQLVEVLAADDACAACRDAASRRHRVDLVPPLPIPGCGRELCRCDHLPVIE